jgi:hypothetical protein
MYLTDVPHFGKKCTTFELLKPPFEVLEMVALINIYLYDELN